MRTVTPPGPSAEDTAARELAWYEGLRGGRRAAFASLATELHPVLGDLALASTQEEAAARRLVRHTWAVALPGLDLFAWRCSLRAWVAGLLVGLAHPLEVPGPGGSRDAVGAREPRPRRDPRPGPGDWADLPWGARWGDAAWETLQGQRRELPLVQRQVVVLADVHRWDSRDAADALGLTAWRYGRVLGSARAALHDGLAGLVGDGDRTCRHDRIAALGSIVPGPSSGQRAASCPGCATLARRWQPVATLLAAPATRSAAAPDPELLALFRRWRAARRPGLAHRLSDLLSAAADLRHRA